MAIKKFKFNPEDIQISYLTVLKSHINQEDYFAIPGQNIESYSVDMSNETAFNFEDYAARIRLFFNIDGKDKDENSLGVTAEIALEFHFNINNGEQYFKMKDNQKQEVDFFMASNLMSVAYSTARGIIWQLTLPTLLGGVILPVIDTPSELGYTVPVSF